MPQAVQRLTFQPVNGFKDLQGSDGPRRFTIEKLAKSEQLPKAHTCTLRRITL